MGVGRPGGVAAAVVFLASRAGGHGNGDTVVLDGGRVWGNSRLEGCSARWKMIQCAVLKPFYRRLRLTLRMPQGEE